MKLVNINQDRSRNSISVEFIFILLSILLITASVTIFSGCSTSSNEKMAIGLSDRAQESINQLCEGYGKTAQGYDNSSHPYVVFDFDNSTAIYDITQNFNVYQAMNMNYAIPADKIKESILNVVPEPNALADDSKYLSSGKNSGKTYSDWADDIQNDYQQLCANYNVSVNGIQNSEELDKLHSDPVWQDFSTKLMAFRFMVLANLDRTYSYTIDLCLQAYMTEQQIYDLCCDSCNYWNSRKLSYFEMEGPDNYLSKVGQAKFSYESGIKVTSTIKDLWKQLYDSGFDIYVCSASPIETVRAAVDTFGLNNWCSGIMGLTPVIENGIIKPQYAMSDGFPYFKINNAWVKGDVAINAITAGLGKVEAIQHVLMTKYGHGPIAAFGDSTGDFDMCTEFSSLKLCLIFNALRAHTNGATVMGIVALDQEKKNIDLKTANDSGNVLYVLNGRDEQSSCIVNSTDTLSINNDEFKTLRDDDCQTLYDYYVSSGLSIKEFFEVAAIKITADNSPSGIAMGFYGDYNGYRSI